MKHLFPTIAFLMVLISAFSQAPQAFNYQGVVRDLSNNPIPNQNIKLQISILRSSATGVEVYKERHNTTTSNLGLFNLQIGTGITVYGTFEDIDWGSSRFFLQIELDKNGGNNFQLIGVSELLSVPYALFAANGSLWLKRPEGIAYINERSSSAINNLPTIDRDVVILSNDDVSTGIRIEDVGSGGQSYSLVSTNNTSTLGGGKFIIYNDSGTGSRFEKTRMSIADNGNVGIANHNPKAKLHISNGDIYLDGAGDGVIMKSSNGSCWKMTVSNSGQAEFHPINCPN